MEMGSEFMSGIFGFLKERPWHMNLMFVVGVVIALFIAFIVLIASVEVRTTIFSADFLAICFCIYDCFQEGRLKSDSAILITILIILLAVLFFIICGMDEKYSSILTTFFGSLLNGFVNMMILCACCTIVLIPLAAMCWGRNDRYS